MHYSHRYSVAHKARIIHVTYINLHIVVQCCTGLLFFLLFFSALACGRHAYQRQGRPCHQHWIYMQHPAHLPRCVSMTLLSYPSLCDIKLNFYRACFLSVREGGLISDRICHLQFIPSRVFLLSPWLSRWRTAGNTSWDPITKVPLQLWQYLFLYFFFHIGSEMYYVVKFYSSFHSKDYLFVLPYCW